MGYFNTYWNTNLIPLQDRNQQFCIGEPLKPNARTAFIIHTTDYGLSDEQNIQNITFFFFLTSGNVQLPGVAASRFAAVQVSDDYMTAFAWAINEMPREKLIANWPIRPFVQNATALRFPPNPPAVDMDVRGLKADESIMREINPQLGVTGGLEIRLRIEFDEINDPDSIVRFDRRNLF
jgi:hypothetical protein